MENFSIVGIQVTDHSLETLLEFCIDEQLKTVIEILEGRILCLRDNS